MKPEQTWFSEWDRIGAVVLAAVVTYLAIIVVVRLSGKRTTANLNSFDWLITVTIGSLASSGILLRDVAVTDALAAIAALALCQFALTAAVRRWETAERTVKAEPLLLLHRGKLLKDNLDSARISIAELRAVLRREGIAEPDDASWVVLETNGELTVGTTGNAMSLRDHWAMKDVAPGRGEAEKRIG
jgi:uncharacterized membrane protein YcaP (DUF421 family)